jgi:hypothetical protein
VRLPGAFPPLRVQLTQSAASRPVTAVVDPACLVGAMFAPTRIGRDGELFEVGAARVGPSLVVALTEAVAAGAASAVGDAAGPSAEYGVVGGELQYVAAEFGADTGH